MRSAKAPDKKRGSVILMVIALLTILAMLGSTLVMVARLDRQTSHAIASSAAPAPEAARSVLDMLRAERATDLCIYDNGTPTNPNDDVVYGNIGGDPQKAIDYPDETVDKALASIEPNSNARWDHITNLGNLLIADPNYFNVAFGDANMVDTDGDGVNDARVFESGITDPEGRPFLAAIRMIDSSGMMNINDANDTRPATMTPMGVSEVSLKQFLTDNGVAGRFTYILDGREPPGTPYDFSDLMALVGDPNYANQGRASAALGNTYAPYWRYLTTRSSSRTTAPPYAPRNTLSGDKIDINNLAANVFQQLFDGFFALLTAYDPAPGSESNNRVMAAQLAINVLQYRQANSNNDVLVQAVPNDALGRTVYGVDRQLYITKLYMERWVDAGGGEPPESPCSAIEMINPYSDDINASNYRVGAGQTFSQCNAGTPVIVAGGQRIVIRSYTAMPNVAPGALTVYEPALNLGTAVSIFRPTLVAGTDICVETTDAVSVDQPGLPPAPNRTWTVLWRDDSLANARYTLPVYVESRNDPLDDPTTVKLLGIQNRITPPPAATKPCPVYVRHGNFVNVGELVKILYLGPDQTSSLAQKLYVNRADPGFANGRVAITTDILPNSVPGVPPACMLSEYFTVGSSAGGIKDGVVNINTAPASVLLCLPGLVQNPNAIALVTNIIDYRDNPLTRPVITNLRRVMPGFATSGEIDVLFALGFVPVNYGSNSSPDNYTLPTASGPDDGLTPWPVGDLDKYNVYYKWLSNQVTVRSDTYIAYILVRSPAGGAGGQRDRRFVALIDRSNCRAAGDLPKVLMMAEIK